MIRHVLAAFALASIAAASAQAAEFKPFDRAQFNAAQAAGKPVLVDVAAWWCPVCHSQEGTIKKTVADGAYDKLTIFKINYDKQKDEWKRFGVTKQATLIAFRGGREIGRLAFKTNKDEINALLASTVR